MPLGNLRPTSCRNIATWTVVALSLVFVLSRAAAGQQSYRTQQSIRPQPLLSVRRGQSLPNATTSPAVRTGRFLGWKEAAKQGPKTVHYFLDLEERPEWTPPKKADSRSQIPSRRLLRGPHQLSPNPSPSAFPGILLRSPLPAGVLPSAIVTGDFNGDGKLDWVVANAGDNTLDLYLGNGDGTAQPPVIIPLVGQSPVSLAAADLTGDGKLDLVVAESDSQTVGILFGNGDGTFQPEIELPAFPVQTLAIAVADVNKDGHPDLIVGVAGNSQTAATGRFAVMLNEGNGNFGAPIYAPNSPSLQFPSGSELSVADVNKDGFPDVLVTGDDDNGGSTQIFLGNGDGTFTAGQVVDGSQEGLLPRIVQNAVLADVNGDGCPDAIVVDSYAEGSIYLGDCKGDFDTPNALVYGMGDNPYGLALADVNGDGYPDLIIGGVPLPQDTIAFVGDVTGDTVGVRLNDGTGHFGPLQVYRGDPGIFALAVADLSGTGYPDIITADQNANSAMVYLNNGSGGFGEPEGGYDGEYEGSIDGFFNPPESGFLATDVNGDGLPDLTLIEAEDASTNLFQITVMLNQGSGLFGPPVRTPAFRSDYIVNDFAFANFRSSAQEDFLGIAFDDSENCGQPQLIYAQNTGNGTFATPVQIPLTLSSPCDAFPILAVGDFNNDGNLDFAVASPTGPTSAPFELTVYLGNGDGTFQPARQMDFALPQGVNTSPEAIFVGDANGDGKQDIFVWDGNNVYGPPPTGKDLLEFLGNGDGTFQAPLDVIQSLYAMTMRDLTGDARLDVIDIASGSPNENEYTPGTAPALVSIYLGQPDGTFSLAHTYSPFAGDFDTFFGNTASQAPNDQIMRPYVGDFTGDGNADIAIFQRQGNGLGTGYAQFLVGNGDGSFTPTYDTFPLGIVDAPDTAAENLFGDGHAAFIQAPNYSASYHILPSNSAPLFQIVPDEIPVINGQGALDISLNTASSSDTTILLSASDPNVQLPTSATVSAGNLSAQVPFTLSSNIAQNRWFSITAQSSGETQTVYDFPAPAGTNPFSLIVVPPPVDTVQPGGISELWEASIQTIGDAAGTFQISCSNLPAGLSCQFLNGLSAVSVQSGASSASDFSVLANSSIATGQYSFNVVATDRVTTLTAPETITVPSPPPPTPEITIPTSFNFPAALVSATETQSLQVYNPGTAPLNITGINTQSGANGTFSQSNNCGASLAPNNSCTITVTFTATSVGTSNGILSVTDNAAGSPQTVSLSASVGDFSLQPAAGASTTITVNAGTPAVFSLQAVANNLDIGTGLTCTGKIPLGNCSVQPASVNVNPPSPTPFQVTVTSKAPSSAELLPPFPSPGEPWSVSFFILLLGIVALSLVFNCETRPTIVSMRRGVVVLLLLATALVVASCGGGTNNTGSVPVENPGTPADTYNFTVTGSSGGVTRTLQVTVVLK